MADTPNESEILALEREYWQAMIVKDGATASRLTGERSVVVGAQGASTISKQQIGAMVRSEGWKLKRFQFSDIQFLSLDANTAVIAYSVKEDLEVDGKALMLEAHDSSVWSRRSGHWECVAHTEAVKGDPFGRDRAQR